MKLFKHQQEAVKRYWDKPIVPLPWDPGAAKSVTVLAIAKEKFFHGDINSLLIVAPNTVHMQWFSQEIPKAYGCSSIAVDISRNEYDQSVDGFKQCPTWQKYNSCGNCRQAAFHYQAQVLGGVSKKKSHPFIDNGTLQIVIVNIETFSTEGKWKEIKDWVRSNSTFVVVDESQLIKRPEALRTQRLLYEFSFIKKRGKQIVGNTPFTAARAILTGTLLTNGPADVWTQLEFLSPGFFQMNYYAFCSRYTMERQAVVQTQRGDRVIMIPINEECWDNIKHASCYEEAVSRYGISEDTYRIVKSQQKYQGAYKHVDELKEKLHSIMTFIKLTDITDLPPQTFLTREIELSPEQKEEYVRMGKELIAHVGDYETVAQSKIVIMVRLQQITSGFINGTLMEDDVVVDQKAVPFERNPRLDRLLLDIPQDEQLIIVTRFTYDAALVYDKLFEKDYKVGLLTGWKKGYAPQGREEEWEHDVVEQFQQNNLQIIVANERAIARGFNLQNCNRMYFYSNNRSLEDRIQCEGRIYRVGQTKPTLYIDYVAKGTIDEEIVQAMQQRKDLVEFIKNISVEDMVAFKG